MQGPPTPAAVGGPRRLNVFLCHASRDKPSVRALYRALREAGCKPWIDEEDIPAGMTWVDAIEKAVRAADVVIACLSAYSVSAEGYLQRELRTVLSVAEEKPEDTIFVVPLRLEECEVPRKLSSLEWVDGFRENGFERLLASLAIRAQQIGAVVPELASAPGAAVPPVKGAYERVEEAAKFVRRGCSLEPEVGLVLGAGMGPLVDRMRDAWSVDLDDIPHYPMPPGRVEMGKLVVGRLEDVPVAAIVGRLHAYDGLRLDEVVFPVRLLGHLRIRALVLTGAAGSLSAGLALGSVAAISDHVDQLGSSPLAGPNDERWGPRFPDMSEVYSGPLRALATEAAAELGLALPPAVLLVRPGPAYETPAEMRYLRSTGADLVGMSIVPEAIAARQMGMPVLALCVVVPSPGPGDEHPGHQAIFEAAQRARENLDALISHIVGRMAGGS